MFKHWMLSITLASSVLAAGAHDAAPHVALHVALHAAPHAAPHTAPHAAAAKSAAQAPSTLGTGAAFAPDGALWLVQTQEVGRAPWPDEPDNPAPRPVHQIVVRQSADQGRTWSTPSALLAAPEPVSADGQNRPKIAFGKDGLVVISWTRPTSSRYTGDIRLLRSTDGGTRWDLPQTVHADRQRITHRFEEMAFDAEGRLVVVWIDKRDLQKGGDGYAGAAIYAAISNDGGASFGPDTKLADHSCECCRIALAFDPAAQRMRALWRHVFDGNERDFMLATFDTQNFNRIELQRATHERWAVEACPHHGGALAIAVDGTQHRTWFNVVNGEGRSFYARVLPTDRTGVTPLPLPAGAQHADVIAAGARVVVAWKTFDGHATQLKAWVSTDKGKTFTERLLAQTTQASDVPHLLTQGERVFAVWVTAEWVTAEWATVESTPVIEVEP